MDWQFNPYSVLSLIGGVLSLLLATYIWQRRITPGARAVVVLMLAAALWSLGNVLELGAMGLSAKFFWFRLQVTGVMIVPLAWVAFVLQYTGHERWLTRPVLALMFIWPLMPIALLWTNDYHHLVWREVWLDASGPFPMVAVSQNVLFWLHLAGYYLLMIFATVLLGRALIRSPRVYRRQVGAVLVAILVPFVAHFLYVSSLGPFPHLDPRPLSFMFAGLALAWGVFRLRLFDIVPVARDAVIRSMDDAVIVIDMRDRVVDVNPAAQQLIGEMPSGLVGQPAGSVLSVWPQLMRNLDGAASASSELMLGEGEWGRYYDCNISAVHDRRGRLSGRLILLHDITERRNAEEQIARHGRRVEALHAVAGAVSQTLDLGELLESALAKAVEVMAADAGSIHILELPQRALVLMAQQGLTEVMPGEQTTLDLDEQELKRLLRWAEAHAPLLYPRDDSALALISRDVERDSIQSVAAVPLSVRGDLQGVLTVISRTRGDFSADEVELLKAIGSEIGVGIQNARLLERTRELSVTDDLTGLYNRRQFYAVLESEIHRTRRYGGHFSLAMLDLDGFKQCNDTLGHASGDAILRSVAQAITSSLRETDSAFRYGGDEFTVILPETKAESARKTLDRIRSSWDRLLDGHEPGGVSHLGFSAGIAQYPDDAESTDSLVLLADAALYFSKREGGNRSTLAPEMASPTAEASDVAAPDGV